MSDDNKPGYTDALRWAADVAHSEARWQWERDGRGIVGAQMIAQRAEMLEACYREAADRHDAAHHARPDVDTKGCVQAIVKMHSRTHEAVGYAAGRPVVTERCDECDKPSPCPTLRATEPHDAEMAAARDADRVARVAEGGGL